MLYLESLEYCHQISIVSKMESTGVECSCSAAHRNLHRTFLSNVFSFHGGEVVGGGRPGSHVLRRRVVRGEERLFAEVRDFLEEELIGEKIGGL